MAERGGSIERQIGARIRARRTELGLVQEQLAAALGLSYQQIQKYENGSNRITVDRLLLLARRLEVPVTYFLASLPGAGIGGRAEDPGTDRGSGANGRADGVPGLERVRDAGARVAVAALVRAIAERQA